MHTRRGFTLVELLCVIAVIMFLVALLIPVITRARDSAMQAACVSNLRQIGLGFRGYMMNWGGAYPQDPRSGSYSGFTPTLVPEYVDEQRVFRCPADHGGWCDPCHQMHRRSFFEIHKTSYFYWYPLGWSREGSGCSIFLGARPYQEKLERLIVLYEEWTDPHQLFHLRGERAAVLFADFHCDVIGFDKIYDYFDGGWWQPPR
jgi:prepilin-type N-terminal cleavage/methylation domain-containing protein